MLAIVQETISHSLAYTSHLMHVDGVPLGTALYVRYEMRIEIDLAECIAHYIYIVF